MTWFEDYWYNFSNNAVLQPYFMLFYNFMEIKRGDKFPFYIYPGVKEGENLQDRFINFVDMLVDAHEVERNKADFKRNFYQRSYYVYDNYLRYQNETIANLMFDTKLDQNQYDYMN